MWKTVKLGDVCTIKTGKKDVNEGNPTGEYPFFTCAKEHTFSDVYSFDCEAILIAGNGAVGQTTYYEGKFEAYQRTYVLTDFHSIHPKLLLFILQGRLMQHLSSIVLGNTIPYIKKGMLQNFEFPLPPLAEQRRIVAKLDAAFAEIDRAIELCQQKTLNAEYIYANKLTQIFEEKGDDWTSCSLKEITSKIGSGATPRGGKAAYKEIGLSLIRSMNVYDMDFSWKELAKIDNEQAQKLSNVEVEKDDVLLNITGASVARCTIVPTDALPARVNQHVAIIRTDKSRLIPKLLAYGLVARINKETLLGVGNSAGATRQAITKRDIEEFVFSFPMKLEAQRNLIEAISHIKHEAIKLADLYRKKQNNFIALKSAILNQELQPPQSEAA